MRSRRAVFLVLVLMLASLNSSCWGRLELEDQSLITVLGVDNGTYKRLRLTARIAVPRVAINGQNASSGSESLASGIPISAEGQTMTDALNALQTVSGREVVAGHLGILVFGEEFAKESVAPILDAFTRTLQFRPNALVAVCKGKAEKFVQEFTPGEETEPSAMLEKLITSIARNVGECPLVTMQEFVNASTTIESDPWAPYLAISSPKAEENGESEQSSSRSSGQQSEGAKNQDITVVRALGAAVFSDRGGEPKMVGLLDSREAFGALLLSKALQTGALEIIFPDTHEEVTLRLRHASVRHKIAVTDGRVDAEFVIRVTSTIEEVRAQGSEANLGAAFDRAVIFTAQDELRTLLTRAFQKLQSMGSDVIKLGRSVHCKFRTYPEWQRFDWGKNFPLVQGSFDVKIEILNAGFVYRHPVPK